MAQASNKDWQDVLNRIADAAQLLRPLVERFLQTGETAELSDASAALLDTIPADVTAQPQHPLAVTSKALLGSLRQAQEGRALFSGPAPEWWMLLEEGVRDAFDDFDRALAMLMKPGAPQH